MKTKQTSADNLYLIFMESPGLATTLHLGLDAGFTIDPRANPGNDSKLIINE